MDEERRARQWFLAVWAIVTMVKVVIAARLPLFVDEAFYWQEGRHLAAAYSDLPGLTAWLTRLGTDIGGHHVVAVRAPFLLMAALLPWLVARSAAHWFGVTVGWQAAMLTVLMPLSGTLGLLALPDVPMALATVLCADAGARLLREVDAMSATELAIGLMLGALSHYRFIGVIGVGLLALLWLPAGRKVLRDPRVWVALAVGVLAWAPLLAWNLEYADAGLRFQLLDRHPWSFHGDGFRFLLVQAAMATPLLFWAMLVVCMRGIRSDGNADTAWRYFALLGAVSTFGFFALGFFADNERVSFHWPLPGYLALLVVVPLLLREWSPARRRATWSIAALGTVLMLGYYVAVSLPGLRTQIAGSKYYPENFAGWHALAESVQAVRATLPADTVLLADNFKTGAELGFALDDADIPVLDHPLNRKHGRAPQLQLWGLHHDGARDAPTLLVVGATDVKFSALLARYQQLCRVVGPLPPPRVVNIDHGARRFLLFALPAARAQGECITPVVANIDVPEAGARVGRRFSVGGWAVKDVVGVAKVEVLLDGRVVAVAGDAGANEWLRGFLKDASRDPRMPRVQFTAEVDAGDVPAGRHWLGLRVTGGDGSVETWAEQPVEVR
ncbi:glycosyltransferase family 39 protein [Pseudoxanthomonas sp. PXM01]|uniref:ArnT family glycosyltransferase n=1 Tax=Pseudoxanthomonas sp. PXM01 TaxID=2769295 RepID=UPI0017807ABD|nr:glycosyltransferase family 39 protein [Pseudoxanthomonas sp. PXM01]MBD9469302.1 glycosyltransferase family 39 protein [Pseudoxanthomonas sp. PXM01]